MILEYHKMKMHEEGTFETAVKQFSAICLSTAVFLLRAGLLSVQYGFANFPIASRIIVWLVAFYVGYRIVKRIVRMWIRMFIAGLKMFVFILTIFLCLAIYLRGSKFFTQDIFYIKETIEDSFQSSQSVRDRLLWHTLAKQFNSFAENPEDTVKNYAKNIKNEYGIEIDESYLDYMNDHLYGEVDTDSIGQKVHEFIDNLGVDVNELGQNLRGMFGVH